MATSDSFNATEKNLGQSKEWDMPLNMQKTVLDSQGGEQSIGLSGVGETVRDWLPDERLTGVTLASN